MVQYLQVFSVVLSFLLVSPWYVSGEPVNSKSTSERLGALVKEYDQAMAAWEKADPDVTPADPRWTEHYARWPTWVFTAVHEIR